MSSTPAGGGLPVLAYLVVDPGSPAERVVPVPLRLSIGRQPAGPDESQQLCLVDPSVSRHHAEIRLDLGSGTATVLDTSTNGTRVNGARIERAVPVALSDGDRLVIGATELMFRSTLAPLGARTEGGALPRETLLRVAASTMALVVGDVVGYSTIAQTTPGVTLVHEMGRLFGELRSLLRDRRGTLADMPGDALFAYWDLAAGPAVTLAMDFTLAAAARVAELAPSFPLRAPGGAPLTMGWAIVVGEVAVSPLGASILGDATNLAFRLSGLAGREDRPAILASSSARAAVEAGGGAMGRFTFDPPFETAVKGRSGLETVFGVRRAAG